MKIYVVTSGEYSDYGINIVTTDRNVAETYIKNHSDKDWHNSLSDYQIEEYEDYQDLSKDLNELKLKELTYKFEAVLSKKNGYAEVKPWKHFYYEEKAIGTRIEKRSEWNGDEDYYIYVHCDDYDKAFKIACDMFHKKAAEELGLI